MENRKRKVQIIVRVTEGERGLIEQKMREVPTKNLSAFDRKMLIDGYSIFLHTAEIKTHTEQLQRIGVDLNRIARRVNETSGISSVDMDDLKGLMAEVWKLERRLLLQFARLTK